MNAIFWNIGTALLVGPAFATFTGREGAGFAWTFFAAGRFVADGDFTGGVGFVCLIGFLVAADFAGADFARAGFAGFAFLPAFFVVARVMVPGFFLVGMSPHIIWRHSVAQ